MSVSSSFRAAKVATQFTNRLPPLPTIGDILRIYRLRALKQLAQNFLLDLKLTNKIVKAAGDLDGCCVLEIGPGPGSLTRSIVSATNVRELTVIERDARFVPVLNELRDACEPLPFHIINDDILRSDLQGIFPEDTIRPWTGDELPPLHIIANLPFNIATPLIIRFLHSIADKSGVFRYGRVRMTLMFQHEVAQRIVAVPSDIQRCRLSVMCQNYCRVDYAFPIRGTSFVPKPDVDAGVVTFTPLKEPIIPQPFKLVERVIRTLFFGRRKRYFEPLTRLFPKSYKHLEEQVINMSQVDREKRVMSMEIEELRDVVAAYAEVCKQYPELASYQTI